MLSDRNFNIWPGISPVVFEGDESFRILLSNVQSGAAIGTPESSVITINEDDVNTKRDRIDEYH